MATIRSASEYLERIFLARCIALLVAFVSAGAMSSTPCTDGVWRCWCEREEMGTVSGWEKVSGMKRRKRRGGRRDIMRPASGRSRAHDGFEGCATVDVG